MNDYKAASAFAALGHETRVAILRLLVKAGQGGLTVSQLRDALGVPATTFAHHLKALVSAGLVKQKRQGREVISTAHYQTIQGLTAFLMEDCCKGVFAAPNPQTEELESQ